MPEGTVHFRVRVEPRSRRPGIGPWRDGVLCVGTSKPAVEGKANADVLRRLKKALGRPVTMVSGERSRTKRLAVDLPAGQRVEDLL